MFAEWNRILNHLMFSGSFPLELGAMTPIFYAFREREMIQDMLECVTGARMHHSYCRVGGLKDDLPARVPQGERPRCSPRCASRSASSRSLIMGNEIIFARTPQRRHAADRGRDRLRHSGPVLQASGVPMDPRKDEPYEKYDEVEFDVPVGQTGDCYDRLWVMIERMKQSRATSSSSAWTSCRPVSSGRRSCPRR